MADSKERLLAFIAQHAPLDIQAEVRAMVADVVRSAIDRERAACRAICRYEAAKVWTPAELDSLDGLDRVDYYDAACRRIESAIEARGAR